jgi:hypothetical protein
MDLEKKKEKEKKHFNAFANGNAGTSRRETKI